MNLSWYIYIYIYIGNYTIMSLECIKSSFIHIIEYLIMGYQFVLCTLFGNVVTLWIPQWLHMFLTKLDTNIYILSKVLFGILKVCCKHSLVYMPVLFWVTYLICKHYTSYDFTTQLLFHLCLPTGQHVFCSGQAVSDVESDMEHKLRVRFGEFLGSGRATLNRFVTLASR